ncbi:uncharacterized protein LTHEOB_8529 [Neofusicoccum parvum]|uniref:Uncharacterized protein LTHEOB_8529 n=1 Tax=Neofusicoccum parvum TaxID=310453 RepID=A0ACB5SLD3_9PEZI|nr:uncharacterized protein LTHEOB_8529 [Neofusicoccum parvum]
MATPTPDPTVHINMLEPLAPQLAPAPRTATTLSLTGETPTDAQWAELGTHFPSIHTLATDSGWNEDLNDAAIPPGWPLRKLVLGSACGEVCRSGWVVRGRVAHLVLDCTAGLRFEGPRTGELVEAGREEGKEEGEGWNGVRVTWVPDLVERWMREKYGEGGEEESRLRTLEIVHNDVHDTLWRYVLAHPRLIDPVRTLSLVAISVNDLNMASEDVLEQVLPQLEELRTLVLVLSDIYRDRERLPRLFKCLPKTLRTLRFRSSVSLAREEVFQRWLDAFGNPEFLPELETLSFVLDLEDGEQRRREEEEWEEKQKTKVDEEDSNEHEESSASEASADDSEPESQSNQEDVDGEKEDADSTMEVSAPPAAATKPPKVSDETLAQAKKACERLRRVAESRGIKVEPFGGAWNKEFTGLDRKHLRVDERWKTIV